jgi:hypothetical protein
LEKIENPIWLKKCCAGTHWNLWSKVRLESGISSHIKCEIELLVLKVISRSPGLISLFGSQTGFMGDWEDVPVFFCSIGVY